MAQEKPLENQMLNSAKGSLALTVFVANNDGSLTKNVAPPVDTEEYSCDGDVKIPANELDCKSNDEVNNRINNLAFRALTDTLVDVSDLEYDDVLKYIAGQDDPATMLATLFKDLVNNPKLDQRKLSCAFKKLANGEASIYDQREKKSDGKLETILEFVERKYPDRPLYQGKKVDGEIDAWLSHTYGAKGFLDGLLFTRKILTDLDSVAGQRLTNWLKNKNHQLADDIFIPSHRGNSQNILLGYTPEQVRAAQSVAVLGLK